MTVEEEVLRIQKRLNKMTSEDGSVRLLNAFKYCKKNMIKCKYTNIL